MKILIVEDDPNKLRQIISFLEELDCETDSARSFNSALKMLNSEEYKFNLIVLDMQLPTFDRTPQEPGGRQRPLAGKQLLDEMRRRGLAIPSVVVTQFRNFGDKGNEITFEQLKQALSPDAYPNLVKIVYYHADTNSWKSEIRDVVAAVEG